MASPRILRDDRACAPCGGPRCGQCGCSPPRPRGHGLPTGGTRAPAAWTPRKGRADALGLLTSATATSPEEDSPARSPAWACWGPPGTIVRALGPGPRGPSLSASCPGSEAPAVTTQAESRAAPADLRVRSTHRAGRRRYPPGRTRRPMAAPPPGLPRGVVSRCGQSLGQLRAPGSRTRGPTEGRGCTRTRCEGNTQGRALHRAGGTVPGPLGPSRAPPPASPCRPLPAWHTVRRCLWFPPLGGTSCPAVPLRPQGQGGVR